MGYGTCINTMRITILPELRDAALTAYLAKTGERHHPGDTLAHLLGERYRLAPPVSLDGAETWSEWFRDYNLKTVFCALAPFVADDGTIDFQGEDGERWRYHFRRGRCYELEANVVYIWDPKDKQEAYGEIAGPAGEHPTHP